MLRNYIKERVQLEDDSQGYVIAGFVYNCKSDMYDHLFCLERDWQ